MNPENNEAKRMWQELEKAEAPAAVPVAADEPNVLGSAWITVGWRDERGEWLYEKRYMREDAYNADVDKAYWRGRDDELEFSSRDRMWTMITSIFYGWLAGMATAALLAKFCGR